MKQAPVNTFSHPIFYRAFYLGSGNETHEGELRARVYLLNIKVRGDSFMCNVTEIVL
jgi:hypothetical protein